MATTLLHCEVRMRAPLLIVLFVLTIGAVHASPRPVPTFEELVDTAGAIALTEVIETRSSWHQLQNRRVIVTDVTVRVDQSIKGTASRLHTISMLGGFVGDVHQHVAGMPTFVVGDTDVLFLSAERTLLSPLVGMSHGRFRVVSGHGGVGRFVANSSYQPILSAHEYSRPRRLAAGERALALDQFIGLIKSRLER